MLTIKPTCTNRIISRAIALEWKPLIEFLCTDADDYDPCENENNLPGPLRKFPPAIIIYNQHETLELNYQ